MKPMLNNLTCSPLESRRDLSLIKLGNKRTNILLLFLKENLKKLNHYLLAEDIKKLHIYSNRSPLRPVVIQIMS